jgi:hypothetical protein
MAWSPFSVFETISLLSYVERVIVKPRNFSHRMILDLRVRINRGKALESHGVAPLILDHLQKKMV